MTGPMEEVGTWESSPDSLPVPEESDLRSMGLHEERSSGKKLSWEEGSPEVDRATTCRE